MLTVKMIIPGRTFWEWLRDEWFEHLSLSALLGWYNGEGPLAPRTFAATKGRKRVGILRFEVYNTFETEDGKFVILDVAALVADDECTEKDLFLAGLDKTRESLEAAGFQVAGFIYQTDDPVYEEFLVSLGFTEWVKATSTMAGYTVITYQVSLM